MLKLYSLCPLSILFPPNPLYPRHDMSAESRNVHVSFPKLSVWTCKQVVICEDELHGTGVIQVTAALSGNLIFTKDVSRMISKRL